MPRWLNRVPLPAVQASTISAPPGESRQGAHFSLQRVVDRDGDFAGAIHLHHFPQKIQTVIRPPFQHIELPLMDHLMGEGIEEFLDCVRGPFGEPLQQREGEADLSTATACGGGLWRSRPTVTGENADRRGQTPAPDNGNRRQSPGKVPDIQVAPPQLQLFR